MHKPAKDYIVFPLDFSSLKEAEDHVKLLDGSVGMFKIGLELFIDQGPSVVRMVKENSKAKIFLDLKLHDISATVKRAMGRVANLGVDLVTVHCASLAMLQNAVDGGQGKTGVLGVTLLTDNDAHSVKAGGFQPEYVDDPQKLVMLRAQMAKDAGCTGIVCSGREVKTVKAAFGPSFLAVTPGIRPSWSLLENDDQKRVTTPAQAVGLGSDFIVIGRPIRDDRDPVAAAQKVIQEIEHAFQSRSSN
ncbi:MAG: orotidine-5'-phosphate decarboxylase [Proteobacteria bacterium]|nr:orotidine-5'-phosphate decarboxylase [Pseudomonadota bacterium]MBU1387424.1 orotidine-5'-phosphate decarboxylase [Pseudomonadota bacterium]MBU1541709.1 orotidine-5'-phosphate decarboxylase [Pseudomonadota bacterium]MBU2430527.1 orotidine-5'-phosphate decarboxylase [Pseudomonadota bacterium]MBU2481988.1 orotidine-5'-phosphate decarboxylase [Pseudomonadota bacterium]